MPRRPGDYVSTTFGPFSVLNARTRQMQAALQEYAPFSERDLPTFGHYDA